MKLKSVTFVDSTFRNCYFDDVTSVGSYFRNCTFIDAYFYNTGKKLAFRIQQTPTTLFATESDVTCMGGGKKK